MIKKEEHAWGTRLTVRPLSAVKHSHMTIHVDVHRATSGIKRDVRVTFTAPTDTLRLSDLATWMNAMTTIQAEAGKVADEYAPPPPKEKPQSRRWRHKTREKIDDVYRLRDNGASQSEIARQLDLGAPTVRAILDEREEKPPKKKKVLHDI